MGEAQDPKNPLLERLKFLSISASNLDEFFMIRMSARTKSAAPEKQEVLNRLCLELAAFVQKQKETLSLLTQEMKRHGIELGAPAGSLAGREIFETKLLPLLGNLEVFTPHQVGSLLNLQTAVIFPAASQGAPSSWLRVPKGLPPVFVHTEQQAKDPIQIFFRDELIRYYFREMFPLYSEPCLLRLTRDGDFTLELEEEDSESIPDMVRNFIGARDRGRPLRLQIAGPIPGELLSVIRSQLKLDPKLVFEAPGSLYLHGLWGAVRQLPVELSTRPTMSYPPLKTRVPEPLRDVSRDAIFSVIDKRDFLLHHPYDSFDSFVNWIELACRDPHVTMIEQTVYRMDTLSPMIVALKAAAQFKKVRVFIELRARFDEMNNLKLADELKKAGVEVAFGFGKLKLHAKIALITRIINGEEFRYTHLSTGNYNSATARQYTDMGILTAHPEIGQDARAFFDSLLREEVPSGFKRLVSAPGRLHRRLLLLIESEIKFAQNVSSGAIRAESKGRIVAKVNALVDESVIQSLYRASQAGVKVDLIVRGACSLVPGIAGLSENIRVISIVDRFLEHSRLYYFESSRTIFLSSADWMPRNFFSRIELAFPILDGYIYKYIEEVLLPAYLNDNVKARELGADGKWRFRKVTKKVALVRAQAFFEELAEHEYKGTPLQ